MKTKNSYAMNTKRARQPRGIPIGGEFASMSRGESDVSFSTAGGNPSVDGDSIRKFDEDTYKALVSEMVANMPKRLQKNIPDNSSLRISLKKDETEVFVNDGEKEFAVAKVRYDGDGKVKLSDVGERNYVDLGLKDTIKAARVAERFAVEFNRTGLSMVREFGSGIQPQDAPNFGTAIQQAYSAEGENWKPSEFDTTEPDLTDDEMLRFVRTTRGGWDSGNVPVAP